MLNGWACLRFPCMPGSWPGRGRVMPRGRRGLGVLGLLLALAASGRAQQLPDGFRVIFVNRDNDNLSPPEIWVADLDGRGRARLFSNAFLPDWK